MPGAKVVRGFEVHGQPSRESTYVVSRRLSSDGHLEAVLKVRLSSPEWAASTVVSVFLARPL